MQWLGPPTVQAGCELIRHEDAADIGEGSEAQGDIEWGNRNMMLS